MAPSSLEQTVEKELICAICTDLIFDPITFLDCLHTNCGSCSKSWFSSQASNRNPTPTCPICREPVRETRPNPSFANLLEEFLRKNPEKKRTDDDIREARAIFKPGDRIVSGGVVVNANTPSPMNRQDQQQRRLSTPQGSSFTLEPLPPNAFEGFRIGFADNQRLIDEFFAGLVPPQARLATNVHFGGHPQPPPRNAPSHNYNLRVPGQPATIVEIIASSRQLAMITCDACERNVNMYVHYECTVCSLYHLCSSCYLSGQTCPARHRMLAQKQVMRFQAPYLETGIFCNVCDEWVDAPAGGHLHSQPDNSFFWRCAGGCNNGNWNYCKRCVRLGACCDHELKLYTNTRPATPPNGVLRGPTPQQQLAGPEGSLEARGYARWYNYNVVCDRCSANVHSAGSAGWYHCRECLDGEFDLCMGCSAWQEAEGECPRGHKMAIMSQGSQGRGDMRTLLKPEMEAPEICADTEPRTAIALRGNFAGIEGALRFPVGAELREVRPALYDDDWCWGTYCGRGGIFEKRLIRLT